MTSDPRYSQARSLHQSLVAQQGGQGGGEGGGPPYAGPPGGPGYPPGGERQPTNFQNPQLLQLRAQIMAYRMLARHQPLPPQIAMAVTGKRAESAPGAPGYRPPPGGPEPRTSGTPPPSAPGGAPQAGGAPPPSAAAPPGSAPPSTAPGQGPRPQGAPPGSGAPQAKPNRVTPIAKPAGIDPVTILQERENRLAGRIAHRIDELTNLPMNIAEDVKTKAEIELRALRLLNFQRSLRAEVVACTRCGTLTILSTEHHCNFGLIIDRPGVAGAVLQTAS